MKTRAHLRRRSARFEKLETRKLLAWTVSFGEDVAGELKAIGSSGAEDLWITDVLDGNRYPVLYDNRTGTGTPIWHGRHNAEPDVKVTDVAQIRVLALEGNDWIYLAPVDSEWDEGGFGFGPNVSVDAGPGHDIVQGSQFDDSIYGGDGDDTMRGFGNEVVASDYIDMLFGGNGTDVIWGDDGQDFIEGNAGNDTILGGNVGDNINGGSGDDSVNGGAGGDNIRGDDETGLQGNDTLLGESGTDVIFGKGGSDSIMGGDNVDDDGFTRTEELFGDDESPADDPVGGTGSDTIFGGEHNDSIMGGGGNDYIRGDTGGLSSAGGADFIDGDYDVSWKADGDDFIDGEYGNDTIRDQGGNDTLSGGEWDSLGTVTLESGNDEIRGGNGNDSLFGGAGCDTLEGEIGQDTLRGEAGDDSGHGGATEDVGYNVIDGGTGRDTIPPDLVNDQDASQPCPAPPPPLLAAETAPPPPVLSEESIAYRGQRFDLSFLSSLDDQDLYYFLKYEGMTDNEMDIVRRWLMAFRG